MSERTLTAITANEVHPYGYHTKSRVDSRKKEVGNNYGNTNQKTYMQAASTCRRCKAEIRDQEICGACGQIGKSGERLHCYDHCLEFIRASPEERLKQVQKHGDCTICQMHTWQGQQANQTESRHAHCMKSTQTRHAQVLKMRPSMVHQLTNSILTRGFMLKHFLWTPWPEETQGKQELRRPGKSSKDNKSR